MFFNGSTHMYCEIITPVTSVSIHHIDTIKKAKKEKKIFLNYLLFVVISFCFHLWLFSSVPELFV